MDAENEEVTGDRKRNEAICATPELPKIAQVVAVQQSAKIEARHVNDSGEGQSRALSGNYFGSNERETLSSIGLEALLVLSLILISNWKP